MAPRNQPTVRRWIIALAIAAPAVGVVYFSCVDVIPKSAITPSAMTETSVRIEMYYQRNMRLPPDLTVLPVREGYANRITDAWGRSLVYTVGAGDAFTLSSLGEDGVSGGTGDNSDLVRRYRIERGEVQGIRPVP